MFDANSFESQHEFDSLNTLLIVTLIGFCTIIAFFLRQHSFYYLPESAAAIIIGGIVGCFVRLAYSAAEEADFLSFNPETFFFILLPPIIFEGAYNLKCRDFFVNFWTICLYAVLGTVLSTIIVGYLVYAMGVAGVVGIDTSSPVEALLFGALISATDPVATLSILGNNDLHCDPLMYTLVFGESLLNDAVAIVLFKTLEGFYGSTAPFTVVSFIIVVGEFLALAIGSSVIGAILGFACWALFKYSELHKYPIYEISFLFLFAFGSYAIAEAIQLSGITSLFFCSLVLSRFNSTNLSTDSQGAVHFVIKSAATMSEQIVYVYIGINLFNGRFKHFNIVFFILCVLFCFIARAVNIFPLTWFANQWRSVTVHFPVQCLMWFAGLRGAIAYALAESLPGPNKDLYVTTTLCIVVFTTVVCGGLTEPFLRKLGLRVEGERVQTNCDNVTATTTRTEVADIIEQLNIELSNDEMLI